MITPQKPKKLNNLAKWYLKYTDRPAYKQYKAAMRREYHPGIADLQFPVLDHPYKTLTTFKHSGNSGDIIYSLPTVYELSKNGKAKLFLHLDREGTYSAYHPLGNVMLNQKMLEMLRPLLEYQPQIECVEAYHENDAVDYDLDLFRSYPFLLDRGSIVRWYFWVYAITRPLDGPWLIAPKNRTEVKDAIVIARSHRYRCQYIDYSFIRKYPKVFFLGVDEEYEDMKESIPNIEHIKVKDFLEMAAVINSCRLFIGNQSFPYSIAEGLKCNRMLETYLTAPNVIPEGKGGYDFLFQPQFEKLTEQLYNNPGV